MPALRPKIQASCCCNAINGLEMLAQHCTSSLYSIISKPVQQQLPDSAAPSKTLLLCWSPPHTEPDGTDTRRRLTSQELHRALQLGPSSGSRCSTVLTGPFCCCAANYPGAGQAGGAVAPKGGPAVPTRVLVLLVPCHAPTTASCCSLLLHRRSFVPACFWPSTTRTSDKEALVGVWFQLLTPLLP